MCHTAIKYFLDYDTTVDHSLAAILAKTLNIFNLLFTSELTP